MAFKDDALAYHRRGRTGKIQVVSTKPLVSQRDLSLAYTPGVAEPCREIAAEPRRVWDYTARGNLVAVVTNGTAVLGLGNIGPRAAKPVMEGKAGLFKKFADIDVFDLELAETDVDKLVDIIVALEPTFGGINLEDIAAPACFELERKLRERMRIPVFHDDQHGTAIITGAALLNACEVVHKDPGALRVVVSGAGAAAIACARFFVQLGVSLENVVLCDSRGVVYAGRDHLNDHKRSFAQPDTGARTLADAMVGADLFLGLSVGGVVSPAMVQSMAASPIVFALANPDPEIGYEEATAARADVIVATGRSDFPNQVNNVLGFPYIFRGALDVRATNINESMKTAAARALAALAREPVPESVATAYDGRQFKFGREYLIPKPFDPRVLSWVAPAVARAAMDSGVARFDIEIDTYTERLAQSTAGASYSIMRGIARAARRDPKRVVFPEAANPKLLRAIQVAMDQGMVEPVLLGRPGEVEALCDELDLNLVERGVEIIDPRDPARMSEYAERFYQLRQRRGVTLATARSQLTRSNYFGMMMLKLGQVDGLVSGLRLSYPATLRPALQILGLRSGVQVATGMYMMVLRDEVKFFADATINIDPTAEIIADIAVQVSDAVTAYGITPRVALISFSNFGSVRHADVAKVQEALAIVRSVRPELEIDGEMQADFALDKQRREQMYPFCRLTDNANVLVFPSLTASNAAYKVLTVLGGVQAVGPILLGVAKPVAVLQSDVSLEDIVNSIAHVVASAQRPA